MIKILSLISLLTICLTAHAQQDEMTKVIRDDHYKGIHSILISQNNKTVYERYFNGYMADSLHDSRSSFKSITSLLIGIAIDKGFINSVNQPVYTFFPEDKAFAADPRKRRMTIKDLLEMRSGFDCDEWTDDGKDCESEMTETHDWVKFSLGLPMKNEPGKVWNYTSCDPMIISGIIHQATGMSIMDFAAKYLFDPMGISHYRWTVDPAGQGMTAGSFYIVPGDMLKIGQLVLNGGDWNGRRIISANWLKESTSATIPIPDNWSFIKISRSKSATPQQTYYGYYWYNEVVKTRYGEYPVIFASGNGGQYIMILKKLKLVAVFTQGNYHNWTAKQAFDLLASYIIPMFR